MPHTSFMQSILWVKFNKISLFLKVSTKAKLSFEEANSFQSNL